MPGKLTYFVILLIPGAILNLFTWTVWIKSLRPRVQAIFATILLISAYWAAIDGIAIRTLNIWAFRTEHVTGFTALGLPVEEWTLFILSGGFIVPLILVFSRRGVSRKGRSTTSIIP